MSARPHCRQPDACTAKGAGHCRGCAGAASMTALHADAERKAAWWEKIAATSRTPERREASRAVMRALHADPATQERIAENGRKQAARIARERRERSAAELGLPVELLPEVRRLQTKGFSAAQAASVLRRSRMPAQAGRAAR